MTASPRKAIRRMSEKKLAGLRTKPWSTISKRSESPRKLNPVAKAKRTARYRKMLSGKEYKAARTEAFERARGRCELMMLHAATYKSGLGEYQMANSHVQLLGGVYARCPEILDLHAHHNRYPKGRKLTAADLTICCKPHHAYLESLKPHKTRMF